MPFIGSKIRKGFVAGAAIAICGMVAPSAANAHCPFWYTMFSGEMSKKYMHVGDYADYYRLSGGSFDPWSDNPLSSWMLDKNARRVDGGDTSGVGDPRRSLEIKQDGRVRSAFFCVDKVHPYFRFSAKLTDRRGHALNDATLRVRVEADGGLFGKDSATPFFYLRGDKHTRWDFTDVITLTDNVDLGAERWRSVRIKFEAQRGDWRIDSVNIDPYSRR